MRSIDTTVTIGATPDRVWEVLTDLESYSEWNSFITSAGGSVAVDEDLDLEMGLNGRTMRISPVVQEAEIAASFEWLGKIGVRGLFDGRHRFELSANSGGTVLTHSERFTGVLAPLVFKMIEEQTREGFDAMNRDLKARAENGT